MFAGLVLTFLLVSQSTARSCPRICPENLDPVCGSDGITYSNECDLRRANCQSSSGRITQAYTGECRGCPEVTCNNNNCGPDKDCKIKEPGGFVGLGQLPCPKVSCVKRECPDGCPFNYEPVCGSDGVTYANSCALEAASCLAGGTIILAPPEECATSGAARECPDRCPFNYEPVCGSDGITYGNGCGLEAASCEAGGTIILTHPGECTTSAAPNSCPDRCPENLVLVCGSDGITYSNECDLRRTSCNSNSGRITQAYAGECRGCPEVTCNNKNCGPDKDCKIEQPDGFVGLGRQSCPEATCVKRECPDRCPFNYEPVCGSDGVTYGNGCALEGASCEAGGTIIIAHPGECTTSAAPKCPPPLSCDDVECEPGHDCKIVNPNCEKEGPPCCAKSTCVKRAGGGAGCPTKCPFNYEPVCGTDSVTYGNTCQLRAASCQSGGDILLFHPGKCT